MAGDVSPVAALVPAITLLGFGAAAALAARATRLSPIVGYLAVGILIGPHVFGFIAASDTTRLLAELGVVFLLFDIGMHVSLRELKSDRKDLLRLAPLHLLLSGGVCAAGLGLIGVDWPIAIAIGISLALSSTAVVARILTEREQTNCPIGRSATHVLIFQDIVAIFVMIYATSLGAGEYSAHGLAALVSERLLGGANLPLWATLLLALAQTGIAFWAAILAGRYVINPVFRTLAATRNAEAFTAFTLLLVLAAACATALAGLSLTLGAFLAGLAVSGTPYRHEVQTEMGPFRGLLLSFFFISVGLALDVPGLIANLPLVITFALGLLVVKSAFGFVAARLSGWSKAGAAQFGFLLAQGSEFTLVILSLATIVSAVTSSTLSVLVAGVALSLALAPIWASLGGKLSRRFAAEAPTQAAEPPASARPVIVIGLTPAGRLAIDALSDHAIAYVATEYDPERFLAAVSDGYRVSFGDATNMKLIDAIGGSNARAVVLGVSRFEVSQEVTPTVRRKFPGLARIVAVDTADDVPRYAELGIRAHVSAAAPEGIEMVTDMLRVLGISDTAVASWMRRAVEQTMIGEVDRAAIIEKAGLDAAA
jgi:Kef-type K+ transport system membrane component KefB/voltage-gated potassium channel Kch